MRDNLGLSTVTHGVRIAPASAAVSAAPASQAALAFEVVQLGNARTGGASGERLELEVHSETRILSSPALTPPTLHGTALYVRDQREIVALDLGPPG